MVTAPFAGQHPPALARTRPIATHVASALQRTGIPQAAPLQAKPAALPRRSPSPVPAVQLAKQIVTRATSSAIRRKLTKSELREMWRDSNKYMVFRTNDHSVAQSAQLEATSTTNPCFGNQKVCFGDGLVGFDYGIYAVIFKKSDVGRLNGAPFGEYWAISPVTAQAVGYASVADIEAAKEQKAQPRDDDRPSIRLDAEAPKASEGGCCS